MAIDPQLEQPQHEQRHQKDRDHAAADDAPGAIADALAHAEIAGHHQELAQVRLTAALAQLETACAQLMRRYALAPGMGFPMFQTHLREGNIRQAEHAIEHLPDLRGVHVPRSRRQRRPMADSDLIQALIDATDVVAPGREQLHGDDDGSHQQAEDNSGGEKPVAQGLRRQIAAEPAKPGARIRCNQAINVIRLRHQHKPGWR